jgi:hypothetical protein
MRILAAVCFVIGGLLAVVVAAATGHADWLTHWLDAAAHRIQELAS